MGWPQITVIVMLMLTLGLMLGKHGEPRPNYNVWGTLVDTVVLIGLLIAGGFFG